ncbi:MAG: RDD family protein [Prochlorotrichaceae cyanobacterium]
MDYDDRYDDDEYYEGDGYDDGYAYDDYDDDADYLEEEDDRFSILRRFPRTPLWRRGAALGIDAIVVGVPSSLGSPGLQLIGFALLWFILRIVVVAKNQGQSLGRWAFDMRIIDSEFGRTPELLPLLQREAILGLATFLALEAIVHLGGLNAWVVMGVVPLGLDAALALTDEMGRQAFHDRVGNTYIVQSRRGYSLDLRLKRLLSASDRPPMR